MTTTLVVNKRVKKGLCYFCDNAADVLATKEKQEKTESTERVVTLVCNLHKEKFGLVEYAN